MQLGLSFNPAAAGKPQFRSDSCLWTTAGHQGPVARPELHISD